MRSRDFNAGLRGTLFEAKHHARMGAAVWLYGWLVLRETPQSRNRSSPGWVLGGKPVSYREIAEETGFDRRTLERWMRTLRRAGYVETRAEAAGLSIQITKAKKFLRAAGMGGTRVAPLHKNAEGERQNCVGLMCLSLEEKGFRAPIGNGCVVGNIERPTVSSHIWKAQDKTREQKALREEMLRQELGAGAGPRAGHEFRESAGEP